MIARRLTSGGTSSARDRVLEGVVVSSVLLTLTVRSSASERL